jgi:hypothetical protein
VLHPQLVRADRQHWVDVENGNILHNMLAQILTGKLSVKHAANSASDNIASAQPAVGTCGKEAQRPPPDLLQVSASPLWERVTRARPYLLIEPVLVAIGASSDFQLLARQAATEQ